MKLKLNILLVAFATVLCGGLSSCSDDDFTSTIFDTTDYPLNRSTYSFPLDTFLKVNYLEPYNLKFIYKMEDIGSDMNKNLTPASYEKSVELAVLSKYLWYDVYKKCGSVLFLKKHSPRIIHVIGSKNYNVSQGTEVLGVAEGGLKITLYNTNNLNVNDLDMMNNYFFRTMHHEFTHILDQTHLHPTDFNILSQGHYNSEWTDVPDSISAGNGFVSSYASSNTSEDWAETMSHYITRDQQSWDMLLNSASYDWEEVDCANETAYQKLFTPGCDIDTIGYYKSSESGQNKVYRRMCVRDVNGYVVLNDNGEVQWTHTSGVDGRQLILSKVGLVKKWLQDYYGINIDDLRTEVQKRQYLTNSDGTFVTYPTTNQYGKGCVIYVNRLTQPADEDPSVTLIEYLKREVSQYESLMTQP